MKELRIRNISKEFAEKIKLIEKEFKTPEGTTAFIKLINKYFEDQKLIKLLQDRNTNLHRHIKKYYDKEDAILVNLKGIGYMASEISKVTAGYAKKFRVLEKLYTKKKGAKL